MREIPGCISSPQGPVLRALVLYYISPMDLKVCGLRDRVTGPGEACFQPTVSEVGSWLRMSGASACPYPGFQNRLFCLKRDAQAGKGNVPLANWKRTE